MALGAESVSSPGVMGMDLDNILRLPEGRSLLTCIQCGVCSATCPQEKYMEYPPRKIVAMLKAGMIDEVVRSNSILKCVSCYSCQAKCPRNIKLTDILFPLIRAKMFDSAAELPEELKKAFLSTLRYGNPLGESPRKRAEWVKRSKVPVRILPKDPRPVDILWNVECYPSYHPRGIEVALATARLFHRLGLDYAILGEEERCIGDCSGYFGEFGLLESLIEHNLSTFKLYRFNRIVTSGAHAFNVFQQHYPRFGFTTPIDPVVGLCESYLPKLKPMMRKSLNYKVTYHDPCCLGRCMGALTLRCFFLQPRKLLAIIPGVSYVEMAHYQENSLCCGGGGGGMWLDSYYQEQKMERLSERVVKEAVGAGANLLAVTCDYEVSRFEDAVKVLGYDDRIIVRDVTELLDESAGGEATV